MNVADISRTFWILTFDGRVDRVAFHQDGSISGVRLLSRENRWEIKNDALFILDHQNEVVIIMRKDDQGFRGHGLFGNKKIFGTLRDLGTQVKAQHYRERANDRILSELRLGASRDFLLVMFNSLGKPFSGILNEWEMYHLPNDLSVDYIRFSCTNTPRTWYVDKEDRVLPQLRSCAQMGYRKMLFCGMSAGGYAALSYSEFMAKEFPDLLISTVTFNPTLLLGSKHYQKMLEFPTNIRSSLPVYPLSSPDGRPVDIPDILIQSSARNIFHEIHFDSQNSFEDFQIGHLPCAQNISLVPHKLGVSHGAGTVMIYKSGAILESIRRALPAMYPTPATQSEAEKADTSCSARLL